MSSGLNEVDRFSSRRASVGGSDEANWITDSMWKPDGAEPRSSITPVSPFTSPTISTTPASSVGSLTVSDEQDRAVAHWMPKPSQRTKTSTSVANRKLSKTPPTASAVEIWS